MLRSGEENPWAKFTIKIEKKLNQEEEFRKRFVEIEIFAWPNT